MKKNATDQKPTTISLEDWSQTPPIVQTLISRLVKKQEQDVAHLRYIQERLRQSLVDKLPENLSLTVEGEPEGGVLLVVDDNEMNRDMLSRRLQRQNHTVKVAENGRAALEMMEAEEFDVVLLDIMMPEMNGYETLAQIKSNPTMAHIPVIMITAVDEIESVAQCIQLGAEDYLPKPFNPVILKARVNASLEKKRLRDQQVAYLRQLNLENQRKSDELEQARKIQLSMLPAAPPKRANLDIAACQVTASEVGGDYYDFFSLADDGLRVAIGDATGHGVASGLMVSMTKASLLGSSEMGLVNLLDKINITLNEIDLGTQLNMALMLLELHQMEGGQVFVRASGGGMPPIYVLRRGGETEEILISGLPLGVLDEAKYRLLEFTLLPGESLLLASDGLPERFNANREFLGFDRLTAALDQIDRNEISAGDVLKQVFAVSDAWAQGYPPHDDITLVIIKVT
jgi:serine phosphatase RsbU (regulator of sigma subunit)